MKNLAPAVLVLLLPLICGCHRPPALATKPPPEVTVAPVVEKEITEWNEYIGRTDAVESVEVRARVSGYLTSVDFKPGSLVKRGDLLFTIDDRPYKADLARADGQLQQARAQQKLAAAEFDRAKQLRSQNVVAVNEFDIKSAALLQSQGATAVAEAEVETAKLNLEFCSIRSPIDGRVTPLTSKQRATASAPPLDGTRILMIWKRLSPMRWHGSASLRCAASDNHTPRTTPWIISCDGPRHLADTVYERVTGLCDGGTKDKIKIATASSPAAPRDTVCQSVDR